MELARLLGRTKDEVQNDRPQAVREAVDRSGAVVVLKGHRTLVGDADGIGINTTGNPGMATGGTGDVLTGLVAGLLAQGRAPVEAAELGVFAHGLAGDLAAARTGELSLAAGDLLELVPNALGLLKDAL
jgi:NAD(P)H-hydrate epimerase